MLYFLFNKPKKLNRNMELDYCRCVTKEANNHLKKDDNTCCVFLKGDWTCASSPKTCISMQMSMCCLEARCGLPTTDEAPCILNIVGITCCVAFTPKLGFMKTMKELRSNGGAPAESIDDTILAPKTAVMSREMIKEKESRP